MGEIHVICMAGQVMAALAMNNFANPQTLEK